MVIRIKRIQNMLVLKEHSRIKNVEYLVTYVKAQAHMVYS